MAAVSDQRDCLGDLDGEKRWLLVALSPTPTWGLGSHTHLRGADMREQKGARISQPPQPWFLLTPFQRRVLFFWPFQVSLDHSSPEG